MNARIKVAIAVAVTTILALLPTAIAFAGPAGGGGFSGG